MDGAGLYGEGSNTPPTYHHNAGMIAEAQVPDSGAVMISLGMSITTQLFSRWMQIADTDARMIDAACSGCTVAQWISSTGRGWESARTELAAAALSPADVDVVWMSVTGSVTESATVDELDAILDRILDFYPNVKQVFVANRTYGGYRMHGTGPAEPGAWQDGLAVKAFVRRHLGETDPWIGWSGDLWSYGDAPRSDGFSMRPSDFSDGLHYATSGRTTIALLVKRQFEALPFSAWGRK